MILQNRTLDPQPSVSCPSLFSFFIRFPAKTFLPVIYRVTNGVPRELYSRVAVTPLASSPWPAHAIYLSRHRVSSSSSSSSPSPSPSPRGRIEGRGIERRLLRVVASRRGVARRRSAAKDDASTRRSLPGVYFRVENQPRKRVRPIYERLFTTGRTYRRIYFNLSRIHGLFSLRHRRYFISVLAERGH